jgi:hypothetical protein
MFAIPKTATEHPDEVAARERLRGIVRGPLQEAWSAWYDVIHRLGRDDGNDEYYDEVTCLISDLEERLVCGREDRQGYLESITKGELIPMFDADGNPIIQDGEQMYTTREHAKRIEAAVAALAQWLEHTPDRTAVECLLRGADYLRGANPELLPDEVDYVVREASKIRRGEQL